MYRKSIKKRIVSKAIITALMVGCVFSNPLNYVSAEEAGTEGVTEETSEEVINDTSEEINEENTYNEVSEEISENVTEDVTEDNIEEITEDSVEVPDSCVSTEKKSEAVNNTEVTNDISEDKITQDVYEEKENIEVIPEDEADIANGSKIIINSDNELFYEYAAYGEKVVFTTAATGPNIKYQWEVSHDDGRSWSNSSATGNKTNRLTTYATPKYKDLYYRCKVYNTTELEYTHIYTIQSHFDYSSISVGVVGRPGDIVRAYNLGVIADKTIWEYSKDGGKTWQVSKSKQVDEEGKDGGDHYIYIIVKDYMNGWLFRPKYKRNGIVFYGHDVEVAVKDKSINAFKKDKIFYGDNVDFGSSSRNVSKYVWQMYKNGTWTNCDDNDDNHDYTMSIPALPKYIGVKFRRIDYIEFDGLKSKVVSEPFSLDAKEVRDIIVNNPVSKSVSVGKTVNFNIKGGGYNGVTYQWQISKDNGKTWKNSGAMGRTTEQLTFKAEKRMNGFKYRCIVTNGDYKAISNVVTLTVK
ncbi:BNR/Asp-box repeat-containing protein [Eubacterium ruminantium]|uniref:BNR/Asp-box repeat-containing protein n=1 Tax=Eubacterium ruminantium TaxID=42322 RepID=A0A1T4K099_9FIRM|nr:immunoglobulin domain-containing protein [Eubacterium ruminantium]SCW28754.1 BNR/Asp-box repeat-containing protein [Eubacterium ruminantium]SDM10729.1 BNR/Asp-box repeat-containing protein [Eubacterium ruminantium]SJZ35833.1 BNR/Asp-box repeat-containing protein [Eubacterium ruminantium]